MTIRVGPFNGAEILTLTRDPRVLAEIKSKVADPLAVAMADAAPKDTGAGAASIHAEEDPDEPGFRVSWEPAFFYLGFHELGTEKLTARPFARVVADRFNSS